MHYPRFRHLQMVYHSSGSLFFAGRHMTTYQSLEGIYRCVVETEQGLTYITDEQNLNAVADKGKEESYHHAHPTVQYVKMLDNPG
jgi:hypothetical protein